MLALSLICLTIGLIPPRVTQSGKALAANLRAHAGSNQEPTHVAVIAPVLEAYAAIDGGIEDVASLSQFTESAAMRGILGAVFPQIVTLPLAGGPGATADPELVLFRQPDLLLIWKYYAGPIRAIGFPHLRELIPEPPLDNQVSVFQALASASGRPAKARVILDELSACRVFVRGYVRDHVPRESTVSVLPMYVTSTGEIWLGPHGYILNSLLEDVRAYNPAADQVFAEWGADPELALKLDPDVIVITAYSFNDTLEEQAKPAWWQALRSVRTRHVYLEPGGVVSALDPVGRTLAQTWFAELVHPSLPHWTRDAYRAIIARAYRYNISNTGLNRALLVNANEGALGYARFTASNKDVSAGPCGV